MKSKKKFKDIIGLQEVLFIVGLGFLGYGLHIYKPWISFSSVGLIILIFTYTSLFRR